MKNRIQIEQFSDKNINEYEKLTKLGDDGKLCYCSFWHAKWASMSEYDQAKKERPDQLKSCVVERMHANIHVGVIVYLNNQPCA